MIQRFLSLLLGGILLSGCTTTTLTNLTPRQLPRNTNGIYTFEVLLDTKQQTLREETIKPYVLIGFDSYPMEKTPVIKNRWEALIPVPANKKFISYRYKFDYQYNRFGPRGDNSKLSQQYQLDISER